MMCAGRAAFCQASWPWAQSDKSNRNQRVMIGGTRLLLWNRLVGRIAAHERQQVRLVLEGNCGQGGALSQARVGGRQRELTMTSAGRGDTIVTPGEAPTSAGNAGQGS